MTVAVIIPALDEAATIAAVVRGARAAVPGASVVVVDGGSRDGTVSLARDAGAVVVSESRRGYGRACQAGVQAAAALGAEVVAFIDAALAEDPADLAAVVSPVADGRADLVLGSRVLGEREPGALRPVQRWGNALATGLIRVRYGVRYTDLGSMRAIRLDGLRALGLEEPAHGWPVAMQVAAAEAGLRVLEVPIRYRRRRGGRSKVSGSPLGAVRAGAAILRVVLAPRWGATP